MTDSAPSVSIVIPTFRRPDGLCQVVTSVLALDYPRSQYELVIIDDEGRGRAGRVMAELDSGDVRLTIESQPRRGVASARNRGAARASGELLLFLDDDMIVRPDDLRRRVGQLERRPRALLAGRWEFPPASIARLSATPFGRFRLHLEQQYLEAAVESLEDDGLVRMRSLRAGDLSMRRQLFLALGGFDESLPGAGYEDYDLCMRARAAGCELLTDMQLVCFHADNRFDLRSCCSREERGAANLPIMERKYPAEFAASTLSAAASGYRRGDPAALVLKRLIRRLLARNGSLALLHKIVGLEERLRLPEPYLQRSYSVLLGLYLYRGYRSGLKQTGPETGQPAPAERARATES